MKPYVRKPLKAAITTVSTCEALTPVRQVKVLWKATKSRKAFTELLEG